MRLPAFTPTRTMLPMSQLLVAKECSRWRPGRFGKTNQAAKYPAHIPMLFYGPTVRQVVRRRLLDRQSAMRLISITDDMPGCVDEKHQSE